MTWVSPSCSFFFYLVEAFIGTLYAKEFWDVLHLIIVPGSSFIIPVAIFSVVNIPSSEHSTATHEVCQDLYALTKSDLSLALVGRGGSPPVPLNLAKAAVGSMIFS